MEHGKDEDVKNENTTLAAPGEKLDIPWLGLTGVLLWLGGLFILIFDPTLHIFDGLIESSRSGDFRDLFPDDPVVINLQAMFIGLALTISGAIFIAAQARSR